MGWLARKSFDLYRDVTAKVVARGFKTQKVYPLETPADEHIELVGYASANPSARIPLLYEATSFPRADRAEPRLRRIKAARAMTGVVSAFKIGKMDPAPARHDALMEAIYPRAYQEVWPHPPAVPPELGEAPDRLAALAVAGPFADYVHRIRPGEMARINETEPAHVDAQAYVIDLELLAHHRVKQGLRPIGCTIVFAIGKQHGTLETRSILYRGELHRPGSTTWPRIEKIALCSLNTHLSIIKHNVYIHLAFITVHAAAAINTLPSGHPVRRLLHHCFHTALIGNHEFEDDLAVTADASLGRWHQMLDEHLPGGVKGYVPTLDREAVKKLCASLIYTSTVTHDNVNNIVWNYTTLTQYIPTIVPEDDEMPPVDVAFDFLTTIIGTFKPYNMLLDGISSVALDEDGARIMDSFVAALRRRQSEMEQTPTTPHTIYPKNLNYSVSN